MISLRFARSLCSILEVCNSPHVFMLKGTHLVGQLFQPVYGIVFVVNKFLLRLSHGTSVCNVGFDSSRVWCGFYSSESLIITSDIAQTSGAGSHIGIKKM